MTRPEIDNETVSDVTSATQASTVFAKKIKIVFIKVS